MKTAGRRAACSAARAASLLLQLADLALDRGDVFLLARDRRAHIGHAVEVFLRVALVAAPLRLAVVELALQIGQARFLALQLGFEQLARIAIALALCAGVDATFRAAAFARTGRAL